MEHPQKTSPTKRRGPPSRAAVLRWVLAAIACSGVLAYFPSVCSAVFLALLVLLVPIGPLEKRLVQFAPRLRRVRTAAIAALFLLAACIAPRETAEPAAPERVIEAGIQEETKTKKFRSYPTPFSTREGTIEAFETIYSQHQSSVILVSYSSNSEPKMDEMVDLLHQFKRHVRVTPIDYRYSFGTQHAVNRNLVKEYLFLGY